MTQDDTALGNQFRRLCELFRVGGIYAGYETIHNGNVNRTYRVDCIAPDGTIVSHLAQRVNTYVFQNPEALMENIRQVTEHIRKKCPERPCLLFYRTREGKNYVWDGDNFWRMSNYIPSVTYNAIPDLQVVHCAGQAFGEFQAQLSDFDITALCETIPDFHNTRRRYQNFRRAIEQDSVDRAKAVCTEINALLEMENAACTLADLRRQGKLPLRVTHNDTKINNVLFSQDGRMPLTVIDLDTVMPGVIGNDFGDAIRSVANAVAEDWPVPSEAHVRLDVFEEFARGFLSYTADTLTEWEAETLAVSCLCMTAEVAVRFLEDYLRGDCYFKISSPEHNLVRARCQIALCRDILRHLPQMQQIVRNCL